MWGYFHHTDKPRLIAGVKSRMAALACGNSSSDAHDEGYQAGRYLLK
jgi:hypothetical protein